MSESVLMPCDFGDWLSPMLVKELRQGMRSRGFVISFLLMQAALLLLALGSILSAAYGENGSTFSDLFWFALNIPLLVVLPISALMGETAGGANPSLELLFLTRLTARRILFGKWIALLSQAALLACSSLPYVVLRYFLGGVDLLSELSLFTACLLLSAVMIAVGVGLSPLPKGIGRVVLGLCAIGLAGGSFILFVISVFDGPGWTSTEHAWWWLLAWLPPAMVIVPYMMEQGSLRLAPPAENHSTALRLLALLLTAVGAGLARWLPVSDYATPSLILGGVLLFITLLQGLCEPPERPPGVYRPFVRRGLAGRLAGRFLYPGWPSAVLFCLLLGGVWMLASPAIPHLSRGEAALILCAGMGGLLFAPAVLREIWPRPWLLLSWYLGIFALCGFAFGAASAVAGLHGPDVRPFLVSLPPCALFALLDKFERAKPADFPGLYIVTALTVLVLFWKMRKPWRAIREGEQRASAHP